MTDTTAGNLGTGLRRPEGTASALTTLATMARRTALKLFRTPQILAISIVQSVIFLLMFRYVIGGAIGVPGTSYVDFLIPGFVFSGLLFTAGGSAVAIAEEAVAGLNDRLRSLPIGDVATLAGRAFADAALMWVVGLVTLAVGFAVGFGLGGSIAELALALGLLAVYAFAFAWVFMWLGLVSGSSQAAQGLSILAVPFSFLSSAFVPIDSMPEVLQVFAEHQPLTFMIDTGRALMLGETTAIGLEHSLGYYLIGSLIWSAAMIAVFAPLAVRAYRKD
ncbi:ABC transporter permease [Thermoleophilia bacterium SCSIO 60948]|nr:ABC transporter permease [Thermoleophilia bacterium SCSIO 60948]